MTIESAQPAQSPDDVDPTPGKSTQIVDASSDRQAAKTQSSSTAADRRHEVSAKTLTIAQLEKLCFRLGRSLRAGIPVTQALKNETRFLKGTLRKTFCRITDAVEAGETVADAMANQPCFPSMLVETVRVGEETGRLDQAFLRLADHYRNYVRMRRTFLQGITWPVLQLITATGVISLLFVIMGLLEARMAYFEAPDIFLLGLSPFGNLMVFWGLILTGCVALWLAVKGTASGWFGRLPMKLAMRIPLLGDTIRTMSLSRFAWSFGTAIDSGMDAVRAIRLGVRSTQNHVFTVHEEPIAESVARGDDFYSSLYLTDAFPDDVLQAVQVGEQTGEITESLERLSDDYRDQAEVSLRRISQITGFGIFLSVSGMIGIAVLLMYANYLGTLHEALANPMSTTEQIQSGEKSTNPVIAAKNEAVKDFVENNEDFQKIKSIYEHLSKINSMTPDEFLDGF